ncbi:hypothetical protein ACIGEO_02910 [Stenotrophomonas bentonitica]|uniref:hypothetical protein n=1 Tax=Stenotrophomonas bentonitica TaxID=1450134 RepID=UPI0037D45EEE
MSILSDPDSILELAVQLSIARDVSLNQVVDEIFAAREAILMSAAKIKETVS